jgi:hypothetical protein
MVTKLNVGAVLNFDQTSILVTIGNRNSRTTVSVALTIDQGDELLEQLRHCMNEVHSEELYEEYLDRQGLTHEQALDVMLRSDDLEVVQIDQGTIG